MEVDKDVLDVPVEIGKTLHQEHHLKLQLGTQMWINSIQLQYHVIYLKLNNFVKNYTDKHTSIYKYRSIQVRHIYDTKNNAKYHS